MTTEKEKGMSLNQPVLPASKSAGRRSFEQEIEQRKAQPIEDGPVTGELHDWRKIEIDDHFRIEGKIVGDVRQRFADGTTIHTSPIARMEGDLAITLNSVYRVVGEPLEPIKLR